MKDILRLGKYLRPYAARILLAVLASFVSAACLAGFMLLVKPIIDEMFKPSNSQTVTVSGAVAGSVAPAVPGSLTAAEAAADSDAPDSARKVQPENATGSLPPSGPPDATATPVGSATPPRAGVEDQGLLARMKAWGRARQEWIEGALGIRRMRDYLREAPYSRVPLAVVLIFFLKGIFTYFAEYWLKWVGFRTIQDLRLALFEKVLSQSARFFSDHPTGLLMSRVMGDVGRLQKIASSNLADAVRLTFVVLLMIGVVFYFSWQLALICLVGMPLVLVPLVRFGRRLKAASRMSQEKAADVSNIINEVISGNRIVKAFGMEAFETSRFRAGLIRMFRSDAKALRTVALTSPVLEFSGAILGGALFWYAGRLIHHGLLDGPSFFLFLVALGYLFVSLKSLSAMNNDLQQAVAAATRVFEMMDTPNEIVEAPGAQDIPPFSRDLKLSNVTFRYEDRVVLDGIDLTARAGEVHALVGSSGAGKTTLINLIPRFYDVTGGAITIDSVDVRGTTLRSLRGQIALVTQEMILFNDSARNNIAYGNPAIPLEDVRRAARDAGAHEFIEELPQGYDTLIGERGTRLSAGQRQRITIARAFLKNAPILILDEATSALDSESEALVQKALEALMKGRTSIVIAHRLSTIRRADCIHVLENGRIVERGRHDELISRGGPYSRLYEIQFREAEV